MYFTELEFAMEYPNTDFLHVKFELIVLSKQASVLATVHFWPVTVAANHTNVKNFADDPFFSRRYLSSFPYISLIFK